MVNELILFLVVCCWGEKEVRNCERNSKIDGFNQQRCNLEADKQRSAVAFSIPGVDGGEMMEFWCR